MLYPLLLAAAEDGGSPNLFAGSILQSIAAIVAFLLLLLVLKAKAWGPILKGLQDRENKIRQDLQSAEDAAKAAQTTLAEYQQQLADARKEAQSIVAEARTAAQQAANADKAKIEAEVAQMKASAKADIASAKEAALADIYTQAASLSTAIAGKILQREISDADQQTLVSESVEQFKASSARN
ncbi:MAG: F0F1 ATP synthase subunit B [Planctomycetota bacterium]